MEAHVRRSSTLVSTTVARNLSQLGFRIKLVDIAKNGVTSFTG
ncbi:hypothetical protein THTE_3379 [Thermogutta terrifontis]|uniref:Uncharacterized protein n=1 Tax=Thermogutta terrifontis TaxID=1331910 RepID=A0A286RJ34_9BACT|nr:hypothetical protein THTE_3379 [Thermogutta terrifontis]